MSNSFIGLEIPPTLPVERALSSKIASPRHLSEELKRLVGPGQYRVEVGILHLDYRGLRLGCVLILIE